MKKLVLLALLFAGGVVSGQTLFTQSTNQNIWASNSAACTTSGPGTIHNNGFIRLFHNDDYNIQDTVFFVSIQLAVESTTGGSYDVIGRIYELNGPLLYANMTLMEADTAAIYPDSSMYKMIIPIEGGYTLPGDSIVVEVFAPINGLVTFYPGSNPYVETGSSYIAASGCGLPEPSTFASIGFPSVKLIMNLWVNHKPAMNDIPLSIFKDDVLSLTKTDFDLAMNDHDADTVGMIRIMTLPANGLLEMEGTALAVGDTVYSNELDSLTYTPGAGFSGTDNFEFRVRDNSHWSNDSTAVHIDVINWQLALNENEAGDFALYPNPATSIVQLQLPGEPLAINVYDVNGRLAGTCGITSTSIDISGYPDGTYFVTVLTANGLYSGQFIKQ